MTVQFALWKMRMSRSLKHSGSGICILALQKPGPRESSSIQVSPQVLLEVGKWKGCTSEPENQVRLSSLDGSTADCLQFWLLFAWQMTKVRFFSCLSLYFVVVEVFSFCFFWKGVTEQQKGCLCFSWLWQFGSGGLWGGKGGDYSVCTHMERLLTKHMSHVLLVAEEQMQAKPQRSRRGYIPRDPEGHSEGCSNPGSSVSCWAPEHLEGELVLKGKRMQGEDLFSKLLFIAS